MPKQLLTLNIQPRNPRILYIGAGTTTPGITYLNALKDAGFNVYHVGEGSHDFDLAHIPKRPYIVRTPTGQASVMIRNMPLKSLLDIVGYEFDLIFHVQDWTYFTDTERSPLPYFFYCTEIAYTFVHKSVWFVLAATEAIKNIILQDFPFVQGVIYHPHSILINKGGIKYPERQRKHSVFFAGEIYRLGELYEERRRVVKAVETVEGASVHYLAPQTSNNPQEMRKAEKGLGILNAKQYVDFLLDAFTGLNVPTIGGANFRDIEIPGAGAMLLTRRTPDMDIMGFQDGINCRFYDTPEEAKQIALEGYDSEIAKAGWELVMRGRRWMKHDNPNLIYRGAMTHPDNQPSELIFDLTKPILEALKPTIDKLKTDGLIIDFKYIEPISKLCLEVAVEDFDKKSQNIFQILGFKEWHIDGHTIYHRIKELAVIFNKFVGINIPKKVIENIPQ